MYSAMFRIGLYFERRLAMSRSRLSSVFRHRIWAWWYWVGWLMADTKVSKLTGKESISKTGGDLPLGAAIMADAKREKKEEGRRDRDC